MSYARAAALVIGWALLGLFFLALARGVGFTGLWVVLPYLAVFLAGLAFLFVWITNKWKRGETQ